MKSRFWWRVAAAVIVFGGIAGFGISWWQDRGAGEGSGEAAASAGASPEAATERLLAAPLTNLTGDPDADVWGKLAANWIARPVDRPRPVDVVPGTSVLDAHGQDAQRRQDEESGAVDGPGDPPRRQFGATQQHEGQREGQKEEDREGHAQPRRQYFSRHQVPAGEGMGAEQLQPLEVRAEVVTEKEGAHEQCHGDEHGGEHRGGQGRRGRVLGHRHQQQPDGGEKEGEGRHVWPPGGAAWRSAPGRRTPPPTDGRPGPCGSCRSPTSRLRRPPGAPGRSAASGAAPRRPRDGSPPSAARGRGAPPRSGGHGGLGTAPRGACPVGRPGRAPPGGGCPARARPPRCRGGR